MGTSLTVVLIRQEGKGKNDSNRSYLKDTSVNRSKVLKSTELEKTKRFFVGQYCSEIKNFEGTR